MKGDSGTRRGRYILLALLIAAIAAAGLGRIPLARRCVVAGHEAVEEGRYAEAERRYRWAIRLAPGLIDAYNGLAFCLEITGRPDEAIAVHERSVRRDPGNEIGWIDMGRIYLAKKGMPEKAHACFLSAARANPSGREAFSWHRTLHRIRGEMDELRALCEERLRNIPGDPAAIEELRRLGPAGAASTPAPR